jgi:hypothetical protein
LHAVEHGLKRRAVLDPLIGCTTLDPKFFSNYPASAHGQGCAVKKSSICTCSTQGTLSLKDFARKAGACRYCIWLLLKRVSEGNFSQINKSKTSHNSQDDVMVVGLTSHWWARRWQLLPLGLGLMSAVTVACLTEPGLPGPAETASAPVPSAPASSAPLSASTQQAPSTQTVASSVVIAATSVPAATSAAPVLTSTASAKASVTAAGSVAVGSGSVKPAGSAALSASVAPPAMSTAFVNPYPPIMGGTMGKTTRYWDCCKPSCGWSGKGGRTIDSCDLSNNNIGVNDMSKSVCDNNGEAQTCHSMAPFAVTDKLAYGFAAVNGATCGSCYQIQFTGSGSGMDPGSAAIKDKTMIVMATNIGDIGANHFDLLIPGGGLGAITSGCPKALKNVNLGATRGGYLQDCLSNGDLNGRKNCVKQKCAQLGSAGFKDMEAGCLWFVDWFQVADNPNIVYKQLSSCPEELNKFAN